MNFKLLVLFACCLVLAAYIHQAEAVQNCDEINNLVCRRPNSGDQCLDQVRDSCKRCCSHNGKLYGGLIGGQQTCACG